jgi:hypothetical protein
MARGASTNVTDILNSNSLSEYDKTLLHAQEYQRYLHHLKRALLVPKEEAYLGNLSSSRRPPPPPPPPPSPPSSPPQLTPTQTPSQRRQRNRRPKRPPQDTPSSSTPRADETLVPSTPRRTGIARLGTPIVHESLTPPATTSTKAYSEQRLVADMAPEDRPRAIKILEIIKGQPNMSWNPQNGTVRINKRMETDGNIKGLLVDLLANKRQLSTRRQYDAVSRLMRQ